MSTSLKDQSQLLHNEPQASARQPANSIQTPSDATSRSSLLRWLSDKSLTWFSGNPAIAFSVVGGFLFYMVGYGHKTALLPFGVTPAEVGIDYATTIWGAVPLILAVIIFFFVGFFFLKQGKIATQSEWSLFWLAAIGGTVVILSSAVSVEQWQYVRVVRQGRYYVPLLQGPSPLSLRADSVQIAWK